MELSQEVRDKLKSICGINVAMYFTDDVLMVSDHERNILCYYDWDVDVGLPKGMSGVGVEDVSKLLGILSLYKNPNVDITPESIVVSEGRSSNELKTMEQGVIVGDKGPFPQKEGFIDGAKPRHVPFAKFELSRDDFELIKSQCKTIKGVQIKFEDESIIVFDDKNSSCDKFSLEVEGVTFKKKVVFESQFFLMLIKDDYKVELGEAFITLRAKNNQLTYFITANVD